MDSDLNRITTPPIGFTYNPLAVVPNEMRSPSDNAYLDTTMPSFSWERIPEDNGKRNIFYQLRIVDLRNEIIVLNLPAGADTTAKVPAGVLLNKTSYRWSVLAYDGTGKDNNNLSGADAFVFTINTATGDINGDGCIDMADISLINAARNTPATGSEDPRDLDGDGIITAMDARKLVLLCTNPRCAACPN